MSLKTPLLRLCSKYFRFFGVPWIETRWNDLFSVLALFWNAWLVVSVTYTMVTMDSFNIGQQIIKCSSMKPLFSFLAQISVTYIFPFIFLFDMIYMFRYSVPIFKLMDAPCFQAFYHNRRQARNIFSVIIFMNSFIFGSFLAKRFIDHQLFSEWQLSATTIVNKLLRYICVFIIGWYQYSNCFILHYYQYATLQLMRRIQVNQTSSTSIAVEDDALSSIQTLANLNRDLNHLLSWPMALYIVLHVFNLTLNLCVLMICRLNTFLMVHSLIIWLYLIYLTRMNCEILKTLKRISLLMRERYLPDGPNRLFMTRQTINRHGSMSSAEQQTRMIRFQQLELYRPYFRINIFHLISLDQACILQITIFILNYVVLLTQTS